MDELLTKEEQESFGWHKDVSTLDWGFTRGLIEPLLLAGSYSGNGKVISVLSEASGYVMPAVLSVVKDKIDVPKKGDWRVISSGIAVLGRLVSRNIRHPEISELYLKFLNKNLQSKIQALKNQAVSHILFACYALYGELRISHSDYIKRDIEKVSRIISVTDLKNAEDLKAYINSWNWRPACETAGFKWEYPSINPNWNTDMALKIFKTIWPEFSFD